MSFIIKGTLPDTLAAELSSQVSAIETLLTEVASDGIRFSEIIRTVFGDEVDPGVIETIRQRWLTSDFSDIAPIEILPADVLGEANGAFAAQTDRIYLSADLLSQGSGEQITAVLLEEIGHWLDGELKATDTPGDEGEYFAGLVVGQEFSGAELTRLQNEDDTTTIQLDGQEIEIEASNGTIAANTRLVKDILPGSGSSDPSFLTVVGDRFFFTASNGLNGANGENGFELWVSDGTAAGTRLVKDINPGTDSSNPRDLTAVGDRLFFNANDGVNGIELWVSDGTETGTQLVKDISSDLRDLTAVGDRLFFRANDRLNGIELWVSDGTEAGTQLVKDINPGSSTSGLDELTALRDRLFFRANDGENGFELWVSDGTAAGTQLVKDINPGSNSSGLAWLTAVGDRLFFTAFDGVNGRELWVSDGTEAGTQLFKDIRPGSNSSNPGNLTAVGDRLFFTVNDGVSGEELWVSDGTAAGTQLVKDIRPGPITSSLQNLIAVGDKLLFTADDGVNGRELWVSDGTEAGTQILPGFGPLGINGSTAALGDLFFFQASDDVNGDELWVSDGTPAGTQLFKDIRPGSNSSDPRDLIAVGDRLFFSALDDINGRELWVSDGKVSAIQVVKPNHGFLEILAKALVYQDWNEGEKLGDRVDLESLGYGEYSNYQIDKVWSEGAEGFYAIGLTGENKVPILAIRGTNDGQDWRDNADTKGVGFRQFYEYKTELENWLKENGSPLPTYITGHSLGGALSQWIGSYFTARNDGGLGEIVTFNAPGIMSEVNENGQSYGAKFFESNEVGQTTHYITSADIVSLFGLDYLEGKYREADYSSFPDPLGPHLEPIIVGELPNGKENPGMSLNQGSFNFLKSPLFNYDNDLDYILIRLIIAKTVGVISGGLSGATVATALGTRLGANALSLNLGIFLDGIDFVQAAASSFIQKAKTAFIQGGQDALEAVGNFTEESWGKFVSLSDTALDNVAQWTSQTWQGVSQWEGEQWDNYISKLPLILSSGGVFLNVVDNLISISPLLLRAANASSFSTRNALGAATESGGNRNILVSISTASDQTITLDYQTVDGTAVAGQDYVATNGTVTFLPGETEKLVPVELLNLDSLSSTKSFKLSFTNPQNVVFLGENAELTVIVNPNTAPTVVEPIEGQSVAVNETWLLTILDGIFDDPDIAKGDSLSYSVRLADGSPLPKWLIFDSETSTLSGTPQESDLGELDLEIIATDEGNATASTTFTLSVTPEIVEGVTLIPTTPDTASLFEGTMGNDVMLGSTAPDTFDLIAGGQDRVQGTATQLEQDRIIGFGEDDVLRVFNSSMGNQQIRVSQNETETSLELDINNDGTVDAIVTLEGDYRGGLFQTNLSSGNTDIVFVDNQAPTNIILSSAEVDENSPVGSFVGNLSTIDPDIGDSHTYSLTNGYGDNSLFTIDGEQLKTNAVFDYETQNSFEVQIQTDDGNGGTFTKVLTINVSDVNEDPDLSFVQGQTYALPSIRDYDGNLHGLDNAASDVVNGYKYQGQFDVQGNGRREGIFTNRVSGRWATVEADPLTGEIDYSRNGAGGTTRVVGIYIDPTLADEPEKIGGPFDSQRRFQNDLEIDNLIMRDANDYDGDGFQELYWKVADGTAYLRSLMHADGNIQYANYQSEQQMMDYLTSTGNADAIQSII
ncbi:hypothetical protein FEK30_16255 (plasmid) [Picosynechococcus sp. PCC 11901]|uniref:ELWxxDGT repeat protein n=1 Tax=Picosynechococcus sp. PCC 11901 TaxID=2579791 RepID=UPI0010FC35A4|nr:ELWxxDGT repeat protein [Picosynechococcus sp. PCC 11901]QCS51065.1 hypothetical protein FEK30_16255 [Picosynechococcus sp. PCC 11901]